MQDNSKHNYDPELVDQGWAMLEKQLDEVLPQKRKRRFLWFWLPLLLGLSTLAGAGLYLNTQKAANDIPATPIVKERNEAVVAELDHNAPVSSIDKPQTPEFTTTIDNATKENISSVEYSSPNSPTHQLTEQTVPAINASVLEKKTVAESANDLISLDASEQTIAQNDNGIENTIPENNENSVEPEMANITRTVTAVPVLSKNDLLLLDETPLTTELDKPTLQSKNRQNWRYYVEGQGTIAIGEQAGLLGVAAGVERKLGEPWSLGFGLAYERSQQKLSTNDIVYNLSQAEADFINSNYAQTGAYNLTQAYQAVSYERIKGELQANYKLHPRWRVGAGLSLAYYRQALFNANDVIDFEDTAVLGNPLGTTDERFNLFEEPVSVYEFDSISNAAVGPYPFAPTRWQLAGLLSVQYQMSPRWAINMNYRHDLTDWQATNTDFGTSSFAQFGLRYYFR